MLAIVLQCLLGVLIGYVFGAFPTGYFVGRLWNVDVRRHGSGRTGGTNVLRTAGWGAFVLTVVGDVLKGAFAVLLTRFLFPANLEAHALAVYFVLVGHNRSVWIAFLAKPDPQFKYAPPPIGWVQHVVWRGRGGAGVMPTVGAVLALFPSVVLVMAPIPIIALLLSRYASVGSLSAVLLFPFVMLFFVLNGSAPWSYLALAIGIAITIVVAHIPNIQRLRAGTERRFGHRLGR